MPTQHSIPSLTNAKQRGTPPSTPTRPCNNIGGSQRSEREVALDAMLASLQLELEAERKEIRRLKKEKIESYTRGWIAGNAEVKPHSGQNPHGDITFIGQGSFGRVTTYPLSRIAYKSTEVGASINARDSLFREFDFANRLYTILGDPHEIGRFKSARAISFWDPLTCELLEAEPSPPRVIRSPRHRQSRQIESRSHWASFDTPTFAMDLLFALPPPVVAKFRGLFFSPNIRNDNRPIRLLRLYFGRTLEPTTECLADGITSDLPLDIARYERLASCMEAYLDLPTVNELSAGMGHILATLHWGIGSDASDIELVLGGNGYHGVQPYVLDYNQCAQWSVNAPLSATAWSSLLNLSIGQGTVSGNETHLGIGRHKGCSIMESAVKLAKKIGHAEFYYPRPGIDQEAYKAFREAYLATVSDLVDESEIQGSAAISNAITAGVTAFFEEYERIDDVKQNKMLRGGQVVNVSDSFKELLRNRR